MNEGALLGLMLLLAGEFNNNEQVWQQGIDEAALSPRLHIAWRRAGDDLMTLSVAEGRVPGAPEWTFEFRVEGERVVSALRDHHCAYAWSIDGDGYEGVKDHFGDCPPRLPDSWRVDADWLIAGFDGDTATSVRARRVTYYDGWIALSRQHIDETAEDDDHVFLADVQVHDEGSMTPILDDGKATGYAVELARLTYQNTSTAVLKLGIIDEATGETLSYAWANPGAERIGINLRWVQCGFTRVGGREE